MSPELGRSGSRAWGAALCALVALALGVRALGIDFGVPVWEEPDAVIAMHVDHLRGGSLRGDRRWSDQNYPHLIARLAEPLGGGSSAPPRTVEEHLAAAARTHVQVRWVVALLSLLAIPGTWWLARPFMGPAAAWVAAAFSGTSLLALSFSQQGRPHAAAGGLFVLAVVAAMRLTRRARPADHLLAAAAAGLALGVLQTGVFVLPALLLGFALRPGARGAARLGAWQALVHLVLLALAVRAFYPFLFGGALGDGSGTAELDGERITLAEHSVALSDFLDGRGFGVLARVMWYYDPVLLVAGALGGILCLALARDQRSSWGSRAELAVAVAFAAPCFLVLGMYAKTYERFAIPLLPFLAALAGAGLERLWARGRGAARAALAAAVLLALGGSAAACARLAWLRSRPDTLDQAGRWIEQHLGRADRVVLLSAPRITVAFDVPLWRDPRAFFNADGKHVKQHSPWTRYQAALAAGPDSGSALPGWSLRWLVPAGAAETRLLARDEGAFVLSLAPAYYVIEPFLERRDQTRMIEVTRLLREQGVLVARFTPERPEGKIEEPLFEWPFFYMLSDHFNTGGYEDWPACVPRLFRARAIGPAVEIYRVDQRP